MLHVSSGQRHAENEIHTLAYQTGNDLKKPHNAHWVELSKQMATFHREDVTFQSLSTGHTY